MGVAIRGNRPAKDLGEDQGLEEAAYHAPARKLQSLTMRLLLENLPLSLQSQRETDFHQPLYGFRSRGPRLAKAAAAACCKWPRSPRLSERA